MENDSSKCMILYIETEVQVLCTSLQNENQFRYVCHTKPIKTNPTEMYVNHPTNSSKQKQTKNESSECKYPSN